MRRDIPFLGVAVVCFVAGRLTRQESASAQDEPSCAVVPNDMNGDGKVDMSDAVRILRHLYVGDMDPPLGADPAKSTCTMS